MSRSMMWLFLLGVGFSGRPSMAGVEEQSEQATSAERNRLELELDRHAASTRWKGVERAYTKLLALQVPLSTQTHYTAALAAESQGDIFQTWLRLERAIRHENALEASPLEGEISTVATLPDSIDLAAPITNTAIATYNSLVERYGRISISVEKGRIPALIRLGTKPFGSTERGAISTGQKTLASEGRFVGMLPIGRYMVDGEVFEVVPGKLTRVRVGSR